MKTIRDRRHSPILRHNETVLDETNLFMLKIYQYHCDIHIRLCITSIPMCSYLGLIKNVYTMYARGQSGAQKLLNPLSTLLNHQDGKT
jgi:hypothetical protein